MTIVGLALLALFDALLSGFRAAAGRDGRILKAAYYRAAVTRAAVAGVAVIVANAAFVAALVASARDPAIAWLALVEAGGRCVAVFGVFATVTFVALLFWFAPSRELRIVPTLLVLGPLTLVRPLVIAGGLVYASVGAGDWRVWAAAAVAGTSMLAVEAALGNLYRERWRRLA
jgi:hypothetical protein